MSSPPTATTGETAGTPPLPTIRPKRLRIWFRIAALAFPVVALVLANLVLWVCDVGVNTKFILSAPQSRGSSYYLNPQADVVYSLFDLRGPEPRAFDLPKPDNTFRVIVVGESSVQGYPYSSELAFPRQLQLVLERQLADKRVEVLNAGIVGISTTPLVDVVAHVLAAEPDLLVMYAGHNEYYGIGGVASNAPAAPWQFAVRRFRLAQALMSKPKAAGSGGDLISSLPKQLEIDAHDLLIGEAEKMFSRNVKAIVDLCERTHVPLLLCGLVSNLRDQSPRGPQIESTSDTNDSALSRERFATACRLDPDNAVAHYRLAQACEAEGDRAAALVEYTLARDLDVCRYRAPSKFREILRGIAGGRSTLAVRYLDLAPVFAQSTELAAPGGDLFLEHVHFNFEGHWLVARTLGRCIVEEILARSWTSESVPDDRDRNEWLGAIPEDHLTAHVLAWFLTKGVPFDRAVDAQRHQAELAAKLQNFMDALTADEQRRLFGLAHQTKINDLVDGLGRSLLKDRQAASALEYFQLGERRRPWMPNSHVFAAMCLMQLGKKQEAIAALNRADQACLPPVATLRRVRDEVAAELGPIPAD